MNYQIQTLNAISPAIYTQLGEHYHVSDSAGQPDAILVRSASMHDMPLAPSVLSIARAGAGTNNIPIDACTQAGVCVFNTPGANANAVCEMVLAAMLLSCRDIVGGVEWARGLKGQGDGIEKAVEKGKKAFVGPELRGKTLGVIGLGAIGVLVANAAVALGMNVVGYDPMISVEHAWKLAQSVRHENSLDELFAACDFITVHVPMTEKTRGMIGRRALSLCKKGVRIINYARGGLVDEAALLEALADGRPVILPVPRYGRGLGILTYICERLPETDIFADRHFITELGHMDATAMWVRPQVQDMLSGKFIRAIPEDFVALGVYFVCDPQLDDIKTRRLVRRLLICGGRVIFTGTVEPNTHASLLLHAGKAQLLRYSVHCTQADMLRIAAQNDFKRIIAYNSDYAPTQRVYEV